MKKNVMIYIFYTFLLATSTNRCSLQKKAFKSSCIDAHCSYLNLLIVPIETLKQIKLSKKQIKKFIAPLIDAPYFKTNLINTCLYEMSEKKSLQYILRIWNMLNRYCFLYNEQLKKEYCILILLIYKNALTYYYKDATSFLDHITTYYHNLNEKELNELLAILNIIAQELKPLMESMHTTKITTWKEWASRYWLKICMTTIVITIKIALEEKKSRKATTKQ